MSADLWRCALDSLDAAVCVVDRDLRVVFANRAWDNSVRQLERPDLEAGALCGQSLQLIVQGDERDQFDRICARLLDGEEASYWIEFVWPTRDAGRLIKLTARTLFDAGNAALGISFMLADITQQKLNEEEALKQRVELRGLFEVAQSIGTINNMTELFRRVTGHLAYLFGVRVCVILMQHPSTGQVTGRTPAHGLSETEVAEFTLPAALRDQLEAQPHHSTAPSYFLSDSLLNDDAECRQFSERWNVDSLVVAPLRNQGRVLGYLALADAAGRFDDETGYVLATFAGLIASAIDASQLVLAAQDRADKLSEALSEIQELDRVKDQMVQNVSHELRLPLMVIQGYADLLKTGALGALAAERQQAVEVISDKATLLGKRISDILLLRGLQHTDLRLEPVSLAELARVGLERARARAAESRVTLIDEIPTDVSSLVADRRRLEQVIDELIDNAIKFSPDGGEVRVAVREGGDVVYLKVSDQGIGIPTSEIPRIWDRFYQADGSTTRRFGGTGVGLAVIKQIVDAHGGQAWAESRREGGSDFYIALHRAHNNGTGHAKEKESRHATLHRGD